MYSKVGCGSLLGDSGGGGVIIAISEWVLVAGVGGECPLAHHCVTRTSLVGLGDTFLHRIELLGVLDSLLGHVCCGSTSCC